MALTYTPQGEIGSEMISFQLPATDGKIYSNEYFNTAKGALVMFICNHCPYVQAIEDRLVQLGKDFISLNIKVLAISSNDANHTPEDSFEKMKERAQTKAYSFPYLYDETQNVAKSFGAVCTPDFFLFNSNKKLVYRGRLDDSWKDPAQVNTRELYLAGLTLSKDQPLNFEAKSSMGCSIKWKEN
ncbi:MAG TPA: thioredoxin family protein [Pseudobdellovibrionaceae bacterium]|nr:thioredoxin family protein [Pseudobdellovibrionaceae bacterium]